MFKKKKIWKKTTIDISHLVKIQKWYIELKKNKSLFFTYFLGTIGVLCIVWIWFWFINQIAHTKFNFDTILNVIWFELNLEEVKWNSNIKKSDDGKTNILIIGRWWKENDAPDLTDSILIASINYKEKMVSMFSIPRDLYVEYPTWYKWRINETYSRGLKKNGKEIEWIESLKEVVKKITWEDIHYYINLDFEWFRQIIDTIGWIDINVPKAIYDTSYPWKTYYETFKISAWPQTLDGKTALKYARSRHSTSDFDRSLRQQLIIKAIREKILSLWFLTNPSKVKSIYFIIKKHIVSDLDPSQIINLSLYVKDLPQENLVSSNLNDTCMYGSSICEKWGFLIVPPRDQFWWAAVLLQEWWSYKSVSDYSSIEKYTNLVFNYPKIYSENLKINVFNSTKVSWLANVMADNLKKYGFNIPPKWSVWNTSGEKYEKSKIFYSTWSGWVKPETIEALELFIFWWSENVESLPKYSKEKDVKIEIIIWDDYKLLNF
jgi:LCP family protein required for cell wall assembly